MTGVLILNHGAGALDGQRDGAAAEDVCRAFATEGVTLTVRKGSPRELAAMARAAAQEDIDAVFVGGGDGTIGTAAGALAGLNMPLGVLPLGTLNHFARDLGLPTEWPDAVKALAHGIVRTVDVAEVNGRVFINNCSIGTYAAAVRRRETLRRKHGMGKWWAMLCATLAEFRELRRMRVILALDDQTLRLRTPLIVVSNNRYSGSVLDYSKRPRLDEGRLWIYTTRAQRRLSLVRLVWQALVHELDAAQALEIHACATAIIERERGALPVALDGELAELAPPLRFCTRPAALHVLAPREPVGKNGGST